MQIRTPSQPVSRRALMGPCLLAALVTLFPIASVSSVKAETESLREARTLQDAFIRIADSVTPAVVFIRTEGTAQHPIVTRPPGAPVPPFGDVPRRGFGSGIIFDPRGYILTNHHVVDGSDRVFVTLSDEREFPAEVVGSDQRTDLAVIRIRSGQELPAVRLGDSDRLRIGQWAVAIGHPYGLQRSVTVGVVSGLGRSRMGITHYENFIQTDASIHPGNSGGPLVNLEGEVIGVNTAVVSRSRGGIGFAIPINMARGIARKLMKEGRVVRGFLGVMIQELSREMAPKFGLQKPEGALISDVMEGGASAEAGLRRGDIVLALDGKPVRGVPELQRLAAAASPGSRVVLSIQRRGARFTLPLVIGALQEPSGTPKTKSSKAETSYGLTVGELTPQMTEVVAERGAKGGVQVTAVSRGGRAAMDGLRVGDIIAEVEHRPVSDETAFQRAIRAAPKNVLVLIYRTGRSRYRVLHNPR